MTIKYLGHSAFQIVIGDKVLLVDPFISDNGLAKGKVNVDEIEADYILLTHGHEDHVADAESIGKRTGATIVSNFEIASWYETKGLKAHPMNHGGSKVFEFGKLKYVQAVHSSVLPDGTYGGNPGGFVISHDNGILYISGDTALTYDMKLLPMSGLKPDLCIFPIGDNFTMDYADAARASDFVECNTVIGCHYDTFGYIEISKGEAVKHFEERNKTLLLPKIGETLTF